VGAGTELRLRPLRAGDEAAALAAHAALAADGFPFLLGHDPAVPWDAYLRVLDHERRGVDLPPGRVPCTFLVAVLGDELVGRSSIRHELNEHLAVVGGHVGYGVVPAHRRRGWATEILRQSLVVARAVGVDAVLVTCDDGNVGSARTIERCGGVLESIVADPLGGQDVRRYWIS
jgi:predicted acetyltransferase